MKAGYTPILGVTKQEFGFGRNNKSTNSVEGNKLYLDIVNNGNSTARDLRIWFGISYNGSRFSKPVRSNEVTLTREEEGSWWPTDTGGALSSSQDSATTFVCDPKLKCHTYDIRKSNLEIWLHDALSKLEENEIEEFRLAVVLRYKTPVGNEEEVPLTAYKADPSKIGEKHLLYKAQEHESKVREYIRSAK